MTIENFFGRSGDSGDNDAIKSQETAKDLKPNGSIPNSGTLGRFEVKKCDEELMQGGIISLAKEISDVVQFIEKHQGSTNESDQYNVALSRERLTQLSEFNEQQKKEANFISRCFRQCVMMAYGGWKIEEKIEELQDHEVIYNFENNIETKWMKEKSDDVRSDDIVRNFEKNTAKNQIKLTHNFENQSARIERLTEFKEIIKDFKKEIIGLFLNNREFKLSYVDRSNILTRYNYFIDICTDEIGRLKSEPQTSDQEKQLQFWENEKNKLIDDFCQNFSTVPIASLRGVNTNNIFKDGNKQQVCPPIHWYDGDKIPSYAVAVNDGSRNFEEYGDQISVTVERSRLNFLPKNLKEGLNPS